MGQTFTKALPGTEWGLPHALDSTETGISCWPYCAASAATLLFRQVSCSSVMYM